MTLALGLGSSVLEAHPFNNSSLQAYNQENT